MWVCVYVTGRKAAHGRLCVSKFPGGGWANLSGPSQAVDPQEHEKADLEEEEEAEIGPML